MKRVKKTNQEMGLEVKSFPKHKQWAVDQDYAHKLSKEEQDWLGQFNQEYYRNRVKKGDKTALHNTDKLRKDCYSRENAANRDLFAIKSVGHAIVGNSTIHDDEGNEISVLDTIADLNSVMDYAELDRRLKKK